MTEHSEPSRVATRASTLLLIALSLVLAAAILLGLRFAIGVDIDAPTIALAVACVVMIWALRSMWAIVVALSRPQVETILVEADAVGPRSELTELREEKARVLRAIKELEFDHAMGKLSDEDFKAVGDRYRLRAIEVLRLLEPTEGDAELHPLLAEHLATVGAKLPGEKVSEA
ncbi:MAG TPA: hypothetical protein VK034_17030 [Enhygromyxa sp.]|nr:hypothetical protein [Enhygromyxa sp.]